MRTILLLWLMAISWAQALDFPTLREKAEVLYDAHSYAKAREVYEQVDREKLPSAEARWVAFRLADTRWRAQAGVETSDPSEFEVARASLEELIAAIKKESDRDEVWAEAQESLGDFFWSRRQARNWSEAWPHYQAALEWWAGSREIDQARERYLGIVRKMAEVPDAQPYERYGYFGNLLPIGVVDDALKIAQSDADKARLHYLAALTLVRTGGDIRERKRVPAEFEAALLVGKGSGWYDDALFQYGQWMENSGWVRPLENGGLSYEPDFERAVELYKRLKAEFRKGETQYYDQAQERLKNLTASSVEVAVPGQFLPHAEPMLVLGWRNVEKVTVTLYPVDLPAQDWATDQESSRSWIDLLKLGDPVRDLIEETKVDRKYAPGRKEIKLKKLPRGAYVVEAKGKGKVARDLLLITDTVVVTKSSPGQLLVFLTDAETGTPIAGGKVAVWMQSNRNDGRVDWRNERATTGDDGVAVLRLNQDDRRSNIFVLTGIKDRQSIAQTYSYSRSSGEEWRIYAFTDRSAYRPGDTAKWKVLVKRKEGGAYSIPDGRKLTYRIYDGRGTKLTEEKLTLNAFGSAWGELPLTAEMALGELRIDFQDEENHAIGGATLLRLEEYKLPEYKVQVKTTEKQAFLLGDVVEADVVAEYYFGGAVAEAEVEVVIYQQPFYHVWWPERPYPWLYAGLRSRPNFYGQGQIIKREQLKTDATGHARVTFETPANSGQDLQFRIEARVTDASRREIVGEDTVRVTRQKYYAHLDPQHRLNRPGDKVAVTLKTIDANDGPVAAAGVAKIVRSQFIEVWYAPDGREVSGDELTEARRKLPGFPPEPEPGRAGWRLKFSGYEYEDIKSEPVKTDAAGEATIAFTPERTGFYQVRWTSRDEPGIAGETGLYVATETTEDLGSRWGGLDIVVDKDTFRTGQSAPVMLVTPTNDRWVLFTTEGEELLSHQVVHVTGTVKLLQMPVAEKEVPNVYLAAVMTSGLQVYQAQQEVVVPPDESFVTVTVEGAPEKVRPGKSGTVRLIARDRDGKPVRAEVALSVSDEAVSYIQSDLAGDPREFFFGQRRNLQVQTTSSLNFKQFSQAEVEARRDSGKTEVRGRLEEAKNESDFRGGLAADGLGRGMMADEALSESPAVMAASMPMSKSSAESSGERQNAEAPVTVRSDFSATAFWEPAIATDERGEATAEVKYPDSTTTWLARARAATTAGKVGEGSAKIVAQQPLIVRLQAPRFFVAGDEAIVSAVINNNTDQAMEVRPEVAVTGLELQGKAKAAAVKVPAKSEARVDWKVKATTPGDVKITVTARGEDAADAMEKSYLVFEHGIDRLLVQAGKVREKEVVVSLDIPKERRPGSESMFVQVTPSMAVTMLDALPYLAAYPYGCTEQTMSRFLPAAIVRKTLQDAGLSADDILDKTFGGITAQTRSKRTPGKLSELDAMVEKGLERLYDFQHDDGGWGWWKPDDSDHYMTAYVVWGLALAREAGVAVDGGRLERGAHYLETEIVEEENHPDLQAWMLHGLTAARPEGEFAEAAFKNLWEKRDRLNGFSRALLALSARAMGRTDQAKILLENLSNGVAIDRTPDTSVLVGGKESSPAVIPTAHWGEERNWYRWSEGSVESTAFALRALMAIDPKNELVEPTMNWLVKNRRGAQWNNTRDTAICVLALNDYLRASGELKTAAHFEVLVNGKKIAEKEIAAEEIFQAPSRFEVERSLLRDGKNEIIIRQLGEVGPLYFSAEARFFSLEEPIPASGNEMFVERRYFKLVPRPTLLKGLEYERVPLLDGEAITSGERVEVLVTVETKNDYEYLLVEDLKPAGLEAVAVRSGEMMQARELRADAKIGQDAAEERYTTRSEPVYQELRDRKVALFISELPQGKWEIRYDLRAEVPGSFHALPVMGEAMYVPEIKANGAEMRVKVVE